MRPTRRSESPLADIVDVGAQSPLLPIRKAAIAGLPLGVAGRIADPFLDHVSRPWP